MTLQFDTVLSVPLAGDLCGGRLPVRVEVDDGPELVTVRAISFTPDGDEVLGEDRRPELHPRQEIALETEAALWLDDANWRASPLGAFPGPDCNETEE